VQAKGAIDGLEAQGKAAVRRLGGDGFSLTKTAMVYVYLIESVYQRQQHYVGITSGLKQRLIEHNEGKSPHTRKFKPWHLVTYTGFADEQTAQAFEKYLKSGSGKTFLKRHFLRWGGR
jgi:putative endonuclease